MQDILITGGAGFVGSHLIKNLKESHKVTSIDKKEHEGLQIDITNYDALDYIFQTNNFDIVIHQAAFISVPLSIENPIETHDTNVTGFLNLLNLCVKYKVKRFIYASSAAVYTPYDSPYGLSKLIDDMYAKMFWKVYGLETIGLRYFNIYGSFQTAQGNVIPAFVKDSQNNNRITIFGTGNQTRDFIHIDDVIQANILAINTANEKAFGETFDIACGQQTSINRLAKMFQEAENINVPVIYESKRKGDADETLPNIEPAKNILGFTAKKDLAEGLKDIHPIL